MTGDSDGTATAVPDDRVPCLGSRSRKTRERAPQRIGWADRPCRSCARNVGRQAGLAGTGAVAADMETAAVAQAARSRGVPWIAVRAIADACEYGPPAGQYRCCGCESGRVQAGRLLAALARQPSELVQLPPLARGFGAALDALNGRRRNTGRNA